MSRREFSDHDERNALEAYRVAACADADAQFDDRALETQRHRILDRLAHLGHPARVIRFPKTPTGDLQTSGVNRKWISVAAAAGLIVGLVGGQLVRLAPVATPMPQADSSAPSNVPATVQVDDGLLGEIELVMQARTTSELRALAEFTLEDQH
ncbi:MAG: anti-sigma factor [Acidimicrobiia bacterium]|nr:anti-sigma factor [Acidimicrobiia bacterium]